MRGLVKRLMIFLIGCYQVSISPLLGDCCRYRPTCSQYAKEAIERHGAFKGLCLAVWRVLRCNPFSKGGVDPVPASFSLIKRRERRG